MEGFGELEMQLFFVHFLKISQSVKQPDSDFKSEFRSVSRLVSSPIVRQCVGGQ